MNHIIIEGFLQSWNLVKKGKILVLVFVCLHDGKEFTVESWNKEYWPVVQDNPQYKLRIYGKLDLTKFSSTIIMMYCEEVLD